MLMNSSDSLPKLSIGEKLAYGLGDSAANLIFQTQITFLMFFYTDVFGIAAGTAGTILLVSRIIDAFNDPIIGALADRTTTRWGRYRPWLLWTAGPLALLLVLCFTVPSLGTKGNVVWAIATYNVLMVLYAANNIPYCALSGVMTTDSHERTSLLSWRFICAMSAALVVNLCTLDLIEFLGRGNEAVGYQSTMALWGVVACGLFLVTFAFTRERVGMRRGPPSSLREDLVELLHNGPWRALFALSILIYIQLALRSGSMLYFFTHYVDMENVLGRIDNFSVFNGVGLAFVMLGIALSKPLSKRFGKRNTFRGCLLLSSIFMAAFALLPRDSSALLFALQIVLHLAFGPTIPILWSMMADVADYSEWKTGRRSTALAFASIIFGLKLGFGIGGWLNGALLEHFGYTATMPVTATAAQGIVMMVSIFPALVLLLGVGVSTMYRLDDRLVAEIETALASRGGSDRDSVTG
jgi:sugar (glycoside-pentoside-hexuronide) transporter